jgi:hypothetical protein
MALAVMDLALADTLVWAEFCDSMVRTKLLPLQQPAEVIRKTSPGFVHVLQRPVRALIALSIVFMVYEIVHRCQRRSGLTYRLPRLHGLGFTGA